MSAINELSFAEKFGAELDKVLVTESKTSFMAQNDLGISFTGAKTIKIPTMELVGLGDYDVDTGYPTGKVTLTHKPETLTKDRGRAFGIDAVEAGDTGVEKLAGSMLGEFVRTKVAPEVDAYVLSKLAGLANTNSQTLDTATYPIDTKPYEALVKMKSAIAENGYDGELVCFMPYEVLDNFTLSDKISKIITVSSFSAGEVKIEVKKINDVYLVGVPSSRMKSAYVFEKGSTKEKGGFTPAEDAKNIQMLMLPKSAACLVKKHEAIKSFEPGSYPGKDAYEFNYRLHYDVFVKGSMLPTIWAMFAK